MKTFNLILLILLFTSKNLFTMEVGEEEKTTFQNIPKELYGNIAKQRIILAIEESADIFTAVEKVTEVIKNTRLIDKSFAKLVIQKHILKDLIETFKAEMKAKFASDLDDKSQEELNLQLQNETYYPVLNLLNASKLDELNGVINQLARLIVAGANPNLVTDLTHGFVCSDIFPFLSVIIGLSEFHKLIPVLLVYGADVNGEKIEFGKYTYEKRPDNKELIRKPILEAIRQPSKEIAANIIYQFKNYNINPNTTDIYGNIPYYISSYNKDLAPLFENKELKK